MKIVMIGDVVGSPGRRAVAQTITRLKRDGKADFVVANAENAAAGKGITGPLAEELLAAGCDVITLGDHTWDQREFKSYLDKAERVIRPANFAPGCPGRGYVTVNGPGNVRITVVNLVGRVFMNPYDDPFRTVDGILAKDPNLGRIVLVDLHAEATSEKVVMGRYLDGRVTCVVGTHTHVQTSDETILPKGTAYITDLGMTGPKDSAIGRELSAVISMMTTGMPTKFEVAEKDVMLEGVILDVDAATGKAQSIKRIREPVP